MGFGRNVPQVEIKPDPAAKRLENLAAELAIAAGQTLKDEFGFTTEQIMTFQDAWLARARKNRLGI